MTDMIARDESAPGKRAPQPQGLEITPSVLTIGISQAFATGGDIARFAVATVRGLSDLRHYPGEVFKQAAVLILSSGLIIWAMEFIMGSTCAVEASYTLKQVGAPLYTGIFNNYCGLREMAPYMWGYIFAAKVGCGMVAELGSMRIADEIDAMEVMGVKSRNYLAGSRVVATWIAIPFLYIVGLGIMMAAEYLVSVVQLGGVSSAGYLYIFWLFQNPLDLVYSLMKIMAMSTVIVFVACYYGYHASGGPVGVGRSTAKSMMLNMILIHVVSTLMTQLFWGLTPNAPIAN